MGLENTARAASDVEKARAVDIVPELAADDGRGVRAEVRVRERRGALSMDEMSQSNRRKPNTRGSKAKRATCRCGKRACRNSRRADR